MFKGFSPQSSLQLNPQFNVMGFMCTDKLVSFSLWSDSFLYFFLDVDGRMVEADPHHIIIEDPDGSCTLILDNMTAEDSGQYMCFATSPAGNASTLGKVTVQGK